jgi:hypothetical protein
MEMAVVFGAFPLVEGDGRFEFGDRLAELVVRNDASFTEALADNADQVLCQILEHHHVWASAAFESNQHDCSLFRYVGLTRERRSTSPSARAPLARQKDAAATALARHLIEHISTC